MKSKGYDKKITLFTMAICACVSNRVLNRFFLVSRKGDNLSGFSRFVKAIKGRRQHIAGSPDAPDIAICRRHSAMQQNMLDLLHRHSALRQQAGSKAAYAMIIKAANLRPLTEALNEVFPLLVRFPGLLAYEDMPASARTHPQACKRLVERLPASSAIRISGFRPPSCRWKAGYALP